MHIKGYNLDGFPLEEGERERVGRVQTKRKTTPCQ